MGNGPSRVVESSGFETPSSSREAAEADGITLKGRSGNDLGLLRELRDQFRADADRWQKQFEAWHERQKEQQAHFDAEHQRIRALSAKTAEIVQEQLAIAMDVVRHAKQSVMDAYKPEPARMNGPEAAVDIAKHLISKGAGLLEKLIETDPRAREKLHEVTRSLLGDPAPDAPASNAAGSPAQPTFAKYARASRIGFTVLAPSLPF